LRNIHCKKVFLEQNHVKERLFHGGRQVFVGDSIFIQTLKKKIFKNIDFEITSQKLIFSFTTNILLLKTTNNTTTTTTHKQREIPLMLWQDAELTDLLND